MDSVFMRLLKFIRRFGSVDFTLTKALQGSINLNLFLSMKPSLERSIKKNLYECKTETLKSAEWIENNKI